MTDFVLVHGAWHGAWCWSRVVPAIWAAGHRAFAVALTGLGERAHLFSPDIRVATHVADVVGVIEAEEMVGAVLVGHSYAGTVITGVADRLERADALKRLVHLDAAIPDPGDSWSTGHTEETKASRRAVIAEKGFIPPADPAVFGLAGEDADWVRRRMTPQPPALYDDPIDFDPARVARFPRSFIDCTEPALPTIDRSRRRVRTEPGWEVIEMRTGHDPMVSRPRELAEILLRWA
ncbi:MAG: alpha/beta fold hydrolase [Siculibacillus sp.]|nr:alpha/beta fold hydrolase [Siculibacillus sp.]